MQETVDVLNREQFIDMLYQLVNTMSDLKQGKIFSIDGTWGYGKTYVLEELERRLSPVVNEDTYDDKFYVFHYNCWQYDYYEEPSVAIISAMLEDSENSLEHRINEVAKAGWETAKEILTEVAGEYVKNKIGVNIVETFQSEKTGIDNQKFKFDKMFAFKKTLDETREKLKRMSEIKTVVIVVDELDRCMPEYAIKVLERLHHLFEGISSFWGSETESILLSIFVLPEFHGKGVGRKIINTLETDEFYVRASRIEIPASITATEFYRKFGYDYKNGVKELDNEHHYRLEKFKEAGLK